MSWFAYQDPFELGWRRCPFTGQEQDSITFSDSAWHNVLIC
jgi:hypothetical protein